MILFSFLPTALLIGTVGFVFVLHRLSNKTRAVKRAFWISGIIVLAYASLLTHLQYQAWSDSGLGQFLLPAYQTGYFYFYSFTRFLAPYVISLVLGLAFMLLLARMNKQRGGVLFEDEEPYIAGLFMFLSGYPGIVIYFVFVLIVYLLWHIIVRVKKKKDVRLPLYYLWPATALLTVFTLLSPFVHSDIWLSLKI